VKVAKVSEREPPRRGEGASHIVVEAADSSEGWSGRGRKVEEGGSGRRRVADWSAHHSNS
jgi:hypothetical protein